MPNVAEQFFITRQIGVIGWQYTVDLVLDNVTESDTDAELHANVPEWVAVLFKEGTLVVKYGNLYISEPDKLEETDIEIPLGSWIVYMPAHGFIEVFSTEEFERFYAPLTLGSPLKLNLSEKLAILSEKLAIMEKELTDE